MIRRVVRALPGATLARVRLLFLVLAVATAVLAVVTMATAPGAGAPERIVVAVLGLGLADAILVDAAIVRMVLVPATMALLGKANWWLPGWLDRVLPHLTVEGTAHVVPTPAESPVVHLVDR